MGLTQHIKWFRIVPMPTAMDEDGIGERVDLAAVEILLAAQYEEGFSCPQPLDLFQPAILFTRSTRRPDEEYIDKVLDRMDFIPGAEDALDAANKVCDVRTIVAAVISSAW
jgi:hypothetical protein